MNPVDLVRFLRANGLNPDDIPAKGSLEILPGVIRYRTYVREFDPMDPMGPGLLVDDGHGSALLTEWRETPLIVGPTDG